MPFLFYQPEGHIVVSRFAGLVVEKMEAMSTLFAGRIVGEDGVEHQPHKFDKNQKHVLNKKWWQFWK